MFFCFDAMGINKSTIYFYLKKKCVCLFKTSRQNVRTNVAKGPDGFAFQLLRFYRWLLWCFWWLLGGYWLFQVKKVQPLRFYNIISYLFPLYYHTFKSLFFKSQSTHLLWKTCEKSWIWKQCAPFKIESKLRLNSFEKWCTIFGKSFHKTVM